MGSTVSTRGTRWMLMSNSTSPLRAPEARKRASAWAKLVLPLQPACDDALIHSAAASTRAGRRLHQLAATSEGRGTWPQLHALHALSGAQPELHASLRSCSWARVQRARGGPCRGVAAAPPGCLPVGCGQAKRTREVVAEAASEAACAVVNATLRVLWSWKHRMASRALAAAASTCSPGSSWAAASQVPPVQLLQTHGPTLARSSSAASWPGAALLSGAQVPLKRAAATAASASPSPDSPRQASSGGPTAVGRVEVVLSAPCRHRPPSGSTHPAASLKAEWQLGSPCSISGGDAPAGECLTLAARASTRCVHTCRELRHAARCRAGAGVDDRDSRAPGVRRRLARVCKRLLCFSDLGDNGRQAVDSCRLQDVSAWAEEKEKEHFGCA